MNFQSPNTSPRFLNVMEEEPATIPVLSNIIDYFAPRTKHNSVVLIKNDDTVISLPYSEI